MTTMSNVAAQILQEKKRPMTINEIYEEIQTRELYKFGAKNPKGVLSQAIREKCDTYAKAKTILFKQVAQSTYDLA